MQPDKNIPHQLKIQLLQRMVVFKPYYAVARNINWCSRRGKGEV